MALPIFLRPLLLIGHYYRLLMRNVTGWLEQSSDQLFGPLEQMIVAVVITGLAMNPGLLPEFRPQFPGPSPVPVGIPIYQQQAPALPAPPSPVPQQVKVNTTASSMNDTTTGSTSTGTGHTLLYLVQLLIPNPIVISLMILLVSVLIHLMPTHLFRRVKHSWDIFWPPWQDRSSPPPSSRTTPELSSRSTGNVPKTKDVQVSAQGSDRSTAQARADPSASDNITDEDNAKRRAILAYQARKTAAAKEHEKGQTGSKGKDDAKTVTISRSALDPAIAAKVAVVNPKTSGDGKTQSEKAREAKDPSAASLSDVGDKKGSSASGNEEDPLMAGDVRPLRSILKKSKKKPRQSKNVHHNHFMTMRGNRAHLVPFPHGLHPPPDRARNTLWWNNIPKNADHMMAPPPVPKVVTDVLAGEDPAELAKKAVAMDPSSKAEPGKEVDRAKEAEKEKLKEREKAKMRAELEAKEKAKALQAKEKAGTATASVSIEPPSQPVVPIDPQIQKATWASQAMLCLLLFYIQEQLGLVLLAFFVWQQLNAHAARHSGETSAKQAIATATARAAASRGGGAAAPPKARAEDEIPPEMKEKLARAEADKEVRGAAEKKVERDDSRPPSKPDKGKGKEVVPVSMMWRDTSLESKDRGKAEPRALTKEERAAYRARIANQASAGDSSSKLKTASASNNVMTKEKWAKLSDEEKKMYMAAREKCKPASVSDDGAMMKEKWGKMSDEEKKLYMAEREKRKKVQSSKDPSTSQSGGKEGASNKKWDELSDEEKKRYLVEREKRSKSKSREEEAAAKAEKWDKMSDEDKKRYMHEKQKREQARRAALKAGEGIGLSAEEKATI